MPESKTTPRHREVSFVEQTKELPGNVKVVERWVPAKEGEQSQALFGNWEEGHTPMRLEGRYINGKRI